MQHAVPRANGVHKIYDERNTICNRFDGKGSEQPLEFNVRDDQKIVEIWLTKTEKSNAQLKESLKPMMKQYKANKYTVVIFESGEQDLLDMTAVLLIYNRKRLAELEIKKEKAKQDAMMLCVAG